MKQNLGDSLAVQAEQLDGQDSLAKYRSEFYLPADKIYFDGNSLGLMSKRAEQSLLASIKAWKKLGIEGWTKAEQPWFFMAEELGKLMAPLVGAEPDEVIMTGSITVNLHQILASFYKPEGKRTKIVADSLAFPSDMYALQSHLQLRGSSADKDLVLIPSRDGYTLDMADIVAALSPEVAMLVLPVVLYRSGQLLDVAAITKAAHEQGIFVVFDAAHSIGAVQHAFHDAEVDAAFWCTYKYLNAGPGAVGGMFVHHKHLASGPKPGMTGWFSSDKTKQFEMSHVLTPADNAGAYQIGTPHVLSMAALFGSLELFHEAGLDNLRAKSIQLTEFLIELVDRELAEFGVEIVTPRKPDQRGGHVAITHPDAMQIAAALREQGVIPDFRPPNIIRLAPMAFYNSFADVEKVVSIIRQALESSSYTATKDDELVK